MSKTQKLPPHPNPPRNPPASIILNLNIPQIRNSISSSAIDEKKPMSEFLVSRGREASYGLGQIGIEYKRSSLRKPIHHSSQTTQTQKIPRSAPTITLIANKYSFNSANYSFIRKKL